MSFTTNEQPYLFTYNFGAHLHRCVCVGKGGVDFGIVRILTIFRDIKRIFGPRSVNRDIPVTPFIAIHRTKLESIEFV